MSFLNILQWGWLSHPVLVAVEALLITAALAALDRRPARDRAYHAVYTLCTFAAATFAAGWIMHWVHG